MLRNLIPSGASCRGRLLVAADTGTGRTDPPWFTTSAILFETGVGDELPKSSWPVWEFNIKICVFGYLSLTIAWNSPGSRSGKDGSSRSTVSSSAALVQKFQNFRSTARVNYIPARRTEFLMKTFAEPRVWTYEKYVDRVSIFKPYILSRRHGVIDHFREIKSPIWPCFLCPIFHCKTCLRTIKSWSGSRRLRTLCRQTE